MNLPERIYLAGFMGSGKSTIGPILANVLGYAFMDLDKAIEKRIGTSIQSFFKTDGEPAFRNIETGQLRETISLTSYIIALGGGALKIKVNQHLIRRHGLLVYLRLTPDVLYWRLRRSQRRPLLQGKKGEILPEDALRAHIDRLLAEREPLYEQAPLIIDMCNEPIGLAVDRVVSALRKWKWENP